MNQLYYVFVLSITLIHGNSVFSEEKNAPQPDTKKSTEDAGPTHVGRWFCEAGSCSAGDGKKYECGVVYCESWQTRCGCSCIEVSNAPYPKGYCGRKSPYLDRLSKGDGKGFAPF